MATVLLMEFNTKKRNFEVLREVDFLSVPQSGDKVTLDIDGIGYIFKVYDVHYADGRRVDVNVIRLSNITEYNSSKLPDIK